MSNLSLFQSNVFFISLTVFISRSSILDFENISHVSKIFLNIWNQGKLHNLWGSVQNKNVSPLVKKLIKISRCWQKSIKSRGDPFKHGVLCYSQVSVYEAGPLSNRVIIPHFNILPCLLISISLSVLGWLQLVNFPFIWISGNF